MMNARNRSPFTASQWQELEQQALIFKYMVSGVPIPPDLIYSIKLSFNSSRLFPPHQPMGVGVGWGCFEMGFGRKTDPEPGRCRRTDGKKWRCSKEVFPDSKYCERHMHRGRNRSRKHVEITTTSLPSNNPSSSTHPSSMVSETNHHHHDHHPYSNTSLHSFIQPNSPSSRPENNNTHLVLNSGSYSQADKDQRYFNGLKEEIDEHAFFSEASGNLRSLPDSSLYNSWKPRTCSSSSSSSLSQLRQSNCSVTQDLTDLSKEQQQQQQHKEQHCFVLGTDFKSKMPTKMEKEEKPQLPLRHFFDELPLKNRRSWLDSEEDPSNQASLTTTQLSISIPISSPDFPISNSRSPDW